MCFCPYSYHYQYCQSVSLSRSVPSYSQRICYLASSQETYSRQRRTLQLLANLQHLDLLITLSPMVFTILTSLPTASITQLKQLCCISMIISSMPSDHRSFHVFASLISLPLSTPLTIRVSSSSLLSIFLLVVFLKALFSVLYFLSCIPPHSALSPPHFL